MTTGTRQLPIGVFAVLVLCITLTSCTADVGEKCGGAFDSTCATKNCVDSICQKSDLGGACKSPTHCNQGYCILDICREKSELGDLCEIDLHCTEGICKYNKCTLGSKGDHCAVDKDCNTTLYECESGECVSKEWHCKLARFFNAGSWGFFGGLIMAIIGIVGAIFGIAFPGIDIRIKGIVISVSIIVVGISLGALGIGIFSACY